MKKVLLTLAIVLVFAVAVSAQDGVAKKWNAYLGAGIGLPMGDFGDGWNMGLHGDGAFGFTVAPGFQVLGKLEYHTFGIDDQGLEGVDGGDFNALMYGAAGRYNFPMENAKISPFLLGGLGMASGKVTDLTYTDPDLGEVTFEGGSESDFYFEVGGGIDISVNPAMSIFLQGRYVSIQTEGSSTSFIPVTLGVRF